MGDEHISTPEEQRPPMPPGPAAPYSCPKCVAVMASLGFKPGHTRRVTLALPADPDDPRLACGPVHILAEGIGGPERATMCDLPISRDNRGWFLISVDAREGGEVRAGGGVTREGVPREGEDPREGEGSDDDRLCPDCGADILGNDPHSPDCPRESIYCPRCHGRCGVMMRDGWEDCPFCYGTGYAPRPDPDAHCPTCTCHEEDTAC